MLALDLAVITFAFAVLTAVAPNDWIRLFAKHLFLLGIIITTGELYIAYGGSVLAGLLFVGIVVWLVFLIFDLIFLIPVVLASVKRLWR